MRLNIELPDEYVHVINMFKISHMNNIKKNFSKSDQPEAVRFIILEYMKQNHLDNYVKMLEESNLINNEIINTNNELVDGEIV